MSRAVIVLDAESSLHNETVGKFKAHPQSLDNWAVWVGTLIASPTGGKLPPVLTKYPTKEDYDRPLKTGAEHFLLVGHNVGFDIHYLCNANNSSAQTWRDWLADPKALIWDTQLAEYRLSGQTMVSPTLDACCVKRNLPTKPGRLKEYWSQGISTEDIPDAEVEPYLTHDLEVTHALFQQQISEAQQRGMLPLMLVEMKARLTTIMMEHNGMMFDSDAARKISEEELEPKRDKLEQELISLGAALTGLQPEAVTPNSPAWLSAVLYGGDIKWRVQEEMLDPITGEPLTFKSGKRKGEVRLKWVDYLLPVVGQSPVAFGGTGEDTLLKIAEHSKTPEQLATFLTKVLEFRDLNKQIGTYFKGYTALTWSDGMIHGNLNHCIAATGRLSSSNPNLQNAAHSPIRAHFQSRYQGGKLVEIDLSQIEVVAQAVLSQDTNMINDIINKVDFHSKRAAFAHGKDYEFVKEAAKNESHPEHKVWKQHRKHAKIVSFQKAYGAGPRKISDTTGLSMSAVKAFMEAEDINYPEVPKTQERWIHEVESSASIRDGKVAGVLRSPTGAEYRFHQQEFNGHLTFKPTEIKNYPIQGFSADILKIILSDLREVVYAYNKFVEHVSPSPVLIVNTVHDSVVFDVPPEVDVRNLAMVLVDHFTRHPVNVLRDKFGFNFNAPISADAEAGSDWFNKSGV